jgi:hypothetical protein
MRGPHVARRQWRDRKTGEKLTSPWYFLFYSVKGEDGTVHRILRRTDPPTPSKRIAEEQLRKAMNAGHEPRSPVTVADVLDGYLDFL